MLVSGSAQRLQHGSPRLKQRTRYFYSLEFILEIGSNRYVARTHFQQGLESSLRFALHLWHHPVFHFGVLRRSSPWWSCFARGHGVGPAARKLDRRPCSEEKATSFTFHRAGEYTGFGPVALARSTSGAPKNAVLKLLWPYAVPGDVIHTVFGPQDFRDGHRRHSTSSRAGTFQVRRTLQVTRGRLARRVHLGVRPAFALGRRTVAAPLAARDATCLRDSLPPIRQSCVEHH